MSTEENLKIIARNIVIEKGLRPDFSEKVLAEVEMITSPAPQTEEMKDLRSFIWCSIDNDDSRDLDQLTYASYNANGNKELWVAISDVDALVPKNSAIDLHAKINTTSIYTPAEIFPMLPEKLSTNLTSLNAGVERAAVVVYIQIADDAEIKESAIFTAYVRNHAKLAYSNVAAWLEQKEPLREEADGLEEALRLHHQIAQLLKKKRERDGALTLESSEPQVRLKNGSQILIQLSSHNAAEQIIEEYMLAANQVMATTCKEADIAILRRVVVEPKYWDQIVAVAKQYNSELPPEPDSKALDRFLAEQKKRDPITFKDLSLTVIKLLGRGQYVVEHAKKRPSGHFALGIPNYTHATAPNRRYPDLIVHRQYKAYLQRKKSAYSIEELEQLAAHCTQQEDAANKAQRQINKAAAALLLSSQIGAFFDGVITGVNEKNCWVRIFTPAVEGKLLHPPKKLQVGNKVRVRLVSVTPEKGFIDFAI